MGSTSDRNLLFGIVALQMDFLTRDQLVVGMQAWVNDKQTPLGEHLVRLGILKEARRALLEPLVDEHVHQHGDDPQRSLAALDSVTSILTALRPINDDDVNHSLATLAPSRSAASHSAASSVAADPYATTAPDPYATQVTAQGDNLDVRLGPSSGDAARFRIIRPHAEGGLGSVYVARDTELDRDVALKEIQFDKADSVDNRNRFTLEAEITGGLEHPGIVPVYGLGTYPDGRPYYAMKFIRGDSLKDAIDAFHKGAGKTEDVGARNLRLRKLLQRFIDVCEAIDYAHTRGVLHRDLKPGNIMLGRHGETLVVDWGLAKALDRPSQMRTVANPPAPNSVDAHPRHDAYDPQATAGPGDATFDAAFERPLTPRSVVDSSSGTLVGSVMGTPAFMSPEQAQGRIEELGPPADVFGLGATLYELLVGRPPYQGKTVHDVLALAREGKFVPPRDVDKAIPKALSAICVRAMMPRIEDRYPTARALADDLERYLGDEPVTAKPDTLVERMGRLVRRHRGAFLSGTAALVLLTIGSIAATVVINAAKEKESAALAQETIAKNEALEAKAQETAAKNVAVAAETAAKTRAEETEAVLRFVEDRILAAAHPIGLEGGQGRDVKLADAVAAAAKYVSESFSEQPLIEARIENFIARANGYFGDYAAARRGFEKVLKIREKRLGGEHPDVLTTLANLAAMRMEAGEYAAVLPELEPLLEREKRILGPEHRDTLGLMNNLASAYSQVGRKDDALAMNRRLYDLRTRKFGADQPDTLNSAINLTISLLDADLRDEALELILATWKLAQEKYGEAHPHTLNVAEQVAATYDRLEHADDACELRSRILEWQRAVWGADHPKTTETMRRLGTDAVRRKEYRQSITYFEQALKALTKTLGPDHPATSETAVSLAKSYLRDERPGDALNLINAVLNVHQKKYGRDHVETLKVLKDATLIALLARQYDVLAPWAEELTTQRRKTLGNDHPDVLEALEFLAEAYDGIGRKSDGLKTRLEILNRYRAQKTPDLAKFDLARSAAASALYADRRFAECITLDEPLLAEIRNRLGLENPLTEDVLFRIGRAYSEVGRYDAAALAKEELLILRKKRLGPTAIETLYAMNNAGTALIEVDRDAEAIDLLKEATERFREIKGDDSPLTWQASQNLAYALASGGDLKDAEALRERVVDAFRRLKMDQDADFLFDDATIAAALAGRNQADAAKHWKEIALERLAASAKLRAPSPDVLRNRNAFDSLRESPAFAEILKSAEDHLAAEIAKRKSQ